jgi:hypothetical protein
MEQNYVTNVGQQEPKFKFPTEIVELPSKGLLYPEENPLSNGKIEIKYMTAKEEDILSNQNYLRQGTVIDKLLQSLIVTKINYNDLLIGDKNAILIAARILGYGKDYEFEYEHPDWNEAKKVSVDLTTLENKTFREDLVTKGVNSFDFTLPSTNNTITFKALTHGDEQNIDREIASLKKINQASTDVSTRMKHIITSVNGDSDKKSIREFVDNYFLAKDLRSFRQFYKEVTPDVDLKTTIEVDGYVEEGVEISIGVNFFWPDASV